MALTRILDPITLNRLEIKNRIFRPAHGTMYSDLGKIGDRFVAYHEARARSGVGLSIHEITSVHPSSRGGVIASDDSVIPGFRRLADAVHNHGMKMFSQLWHGGRQNQLWPGMPPSLDAPPWAPSDIPSMSSGNVPVPMSQAMIDILVTAFAAAARRVREGGLDGIEVHFGHGYLIHNFLSPVSNVRTDNYGGSLENRMRFGVSVLRAIRRCVGDDFPVGVRISDDHVPGGLSAEECAIVVQKLCAEGLVDFVNGSMGSYLDWSGMLPTMGTPTGAMLPSSEIIVAAATVPRLTVGRYRTLEEGDQAIREGIVDMIGFNRAMIADPDLVSKTLAGRAEEVRPCIGCNQGCVGGIMRTRFAAIGCTVNPSVGFENTLSEELIIKAEQAKKIVVVGGGPAGMEAARTAALSGHDVILFEAQANLGGAINIAKRAPKAYNLGDITSWQEQEIYRLGVDVRLSSPVDADDVLAESPDEVIIATGSVPRMDASQASTPGMGVAGTSLPHVYSSHDIFFLSREQLGETALILDDVGHYEALGVAEYLIEQGLAVTYVTRLAGITPFMDQIGRTTPIMKRLLLGDFNVLTRARLDEIRQGECIVTAIEGSQAEMVPASIVVLVTPNRSERAVYDQIAEHSKTQGMALHLVGDALAPRDLQIAIREGHLVGRGLLTA